MTNSENLLAQIGAGGAECALVASTLDAIQEDNGLTLLEAVVAVAKVRKAFTDAQQMAAAAEMLQPGSPLLATLRHEIISECPGAEVDSTGTIMVVEGDRWPYLNATSLHLPHWNVKRQFISVGAQWVITRGESIARQLNHARKVVRKAKTN